MAHSLKVPNYLKHPSGKYARCKINGKMHSLGRFGSAQSRARYERLIADYLASGRSPTFGLDDDGDQLMLADLMLRYLRRCEIYYPKALNSETAHTKTILRVLVELYADIPAASFGVVQFISIRTYVLEHKDWSRRYINRQMQRLARMFSWATSEGLLPGRVYQDIGTVEGLKQGRTSARETSEITLVEDELVDATLPHCPPTLAAMIQIQRLTGARPGEVCQLTPGMFKKEADDLWRVELASHKTSYLGHSRTLLSGKKAIEILGPFLKRAANERLFSPAESVEWRRSQRRAKRKTPLNCGNRAGTNRKVSPQKKARNFYDTQSYGQALARICKKHGLERWTPNQLRHALASEVRRKFGLDAAQVVLGHRHADVTQVYAETDKSLGARVIRQLG